MNMNPEKVADFFKSLIIAVIGLYVLYVIVKTLYFGG